MHRFISQWASPRHFYELSGKLLPWLSALTIICMLAGLVGGLYFAPPDYQQGNVFRIIYVHVPSALLSMMVYVVMAGAAAVNLVWKIKMADVVARCSAPLGAAFTFLALVTGSIWGKPTWGTYWVWDARLTSELILLFLYLGYMGLRAAIETPETAARASGILALVGVVNIPIIHYSVDWWNTLHQGTTISFTTDNISTSMLVPLLFMIVAFMSYYAVVLMLRMRCEILDRERKSRWVIQMVEGG
ncbi:MAG TPA: heme ABC transporter permease [Gammaproteobacteria bacterium]|nr:heme ABC transporter permease [Gammaproteobacteria bacterium]